MTLDCMGYQKKEYVIQVRRWAKRLGATDVTIHYDHSVTASCEDGYICCKYMPTAKELNKKGE